MFLFLWYKFAEEKISHCFLKSTSSNMIFNLSRIGVTVDCSLMVYLFYVYTHVHVFSVCFLIIVCLRTSFLRVNVICRSDALNFACCKERALCHVEAMKTQISLHICITC